MGVFFYLYMIVDIYSRNIVGWDVFEANDNPYSEALFKTLKYQPVYPKRPFDSVKEARQWLVFT